MWSPYHELQDLLIQFAWFLWRTVKCLNGAAGFLKKQLAAEARLVLRADGKQPQHVAGRFRFMSCAKLMRGNGLLAALVGL